MLTTLTRLSSNNFAWIHFCSLRNTWHWICVLYDPRFQEKKLWFRQVQLPTVTLTGDVKMQMSWKMENKNMSIGIFKKHHIMQKWALSYTFQDE